MSTPGNINLLQIWRFNHLEHNEHTSGENEIQKYYIHATANNNNNNNKMLNSKGKKYACNVTKHKSTGTTFKVCVCVLYLFNAYNSLSFRFIFKIF